MTTSRSEPVSLSFTCLNDARYIGVAILIAYIVTLAIFTQQ